MVFHRLCWGHYNYLITSRVRAPSCTSRVKITRLPFHSSVYNGFTRPTLWGAIGEVATTEIWCKICEGHGFHKFGAEMLTPGRAIKEL